MNGIRIQILFDHLAKRLSADAARELLASERPMVDHLEASGFTDAEICDHLVQLHRDYARAPCSSAATGRWVLLLVALLSLSGCATTSTRSTEEVQRRDLYRARGAISVPIATETGYQTISVPIDITVEHDGSESTAANSEAKTTIDMSALSGLVVAGLKQAFPILSSLGASMAPPAPQRGWGNEATAGGLALAAAVTSAWAARERARANGAERRANEHAADADEGWAIAAERGAPRPPRPPTRSTKPRPPA